MNGMNMDTGKILTDIEYLRQSIWRVLSTPIGERIMRPDFGSRLPDLVDYPFNASTRLDMEAAVSDALARWEPTFDLDTVEIGMNNPGIVLINLTGTFFRQEISLSNIQVGRLTTSSISDIQDGEGNTIEDGPGNELSA